MSVNIVGSAPRRPAAKRKAPARRAAVNINIGGGRVGRKTPAYPKRFPRSEYARAYLKRGTVPEAGAGLSWNDPQLTQAQKDWRKSVGWYGKGLYMGGPGGYWAQKLGFKKGGFFDNLADTVTGLVPGGDQIAAGTRALYQGITGRGEYNANDAVSIPGESFQIPTFAPSDDGGAGVVISRKEYIQDIYGPPSTELAFSNQAISINPGLEGTFPWLSQVAMNYDEYDILQLIFTYKSTTSDIGSSTTGQVGQIIMATQYDVADEPFPDKDTMLRYALADSSKTTTHQMHGVECDPAKRSGTVGKYIRNSPPLPGTDKREYDWGNFNIAVANCPLAYANQSLGELWVSYTVRLRKPRIVSLKAYNVQRDIFALYDTGTLAQRIEYGAFLTAAQIINPLMRRGQQNTIGVQLSAGSAPDPVGDLSTGLLITFPAKFSGNVEILIFGECTTALNSTFQGANWGTVTGNVAGFGDIPFPSTQTYTYNQDTAVGGAADVIRRFMTIARFRVGIATSGIDNTVNVFFAYGANNTADMHVWYMDIHEFNTSTSYSQNGSNDQPIWVDTNGNVVRLYP